MACVFMFLFALYFLWMGFHPYFFIYMVFFLYHEPKHKNLFFKNVIAMIHKFSYKTSRIGRIII